ncbi:zinc finger protein 547-like [Hyperolius riggenbachi]|uniref:zinc finger protein 547-like n=1 Tax=Hyperolius riggenbachi TaxID=752182 RepID=UPI0035A29E37
MPYSCSEGGKCFTQNGNLNKHMRMHTGERHFSCSECRKVFCERGIFRRQEKHTQVTDRIHDQTFVKHIIRKTECGKTFHGRKSLQRNLKTHTSKRPYSCSQGGKWFTQNGNLNRHMRIHTAERHFSCSECGKYFYDRENFYKHQETHTGDRQYSCSDFCKST